MSNPDFQQVTIGETCAEVASSTIPAIALHSTRDLRERELRGRSSEDTSWLTRWPRTALCAVVLAGFLMSGFLALTYPAMGGDALHYVMPFINFAQGHGYTYFENGGSYAETMFPPGTGLAAYPFVLILRDPEFGGMLLSLVSYVLLIPASYYVARSLFGAQAGLLTAVVVAFCPTLIKYSYTVGSDVVFSLLLFAALGLYIKLLFKNGNVWLNIALGAVLGLACLTRPEALSVAVLAVSSLLLFPAARNMDRYEGKSAPSSRKRWHADTIPSRLEREAQIPIFPSIVWFCPMP